jgi:membrane associated rhomboid family serine protease
VAGPELSVVCKSCGSEVSPYVTECPYCGARLRRRAPKLEREGDEIKMREGRTDRRRRKAAERAAQRQRKREERALFATERPYVAMAAVLIPAILFIVRIGADLLSTDLGAIFGPVDGDWWRYFAAPFVYVDMGYLFACSLAIAIFVTGLERRVGPLAAALLVVASGALGMLAAVGIEDSMGDGFPIAAGGNGVALGALGAWYALRRAEARATGDEMPDPIALLVAFAVLVALPLVDDFANFWAGLAGGVVGLAAGYAAARGRP